MAREITTVAVVGLGTMGAGIAEVMARHGLDVVAVDAHRAAVEAGRGHVERSTSRAVRRGRLTEEDRDALLGRIRFTAALEDVAPADLVVEAVPEKLDLKREIFGKLDAIVGPGAILATNTSSLSVTTIAAATHDPRRVVGLHFFNPAPVQRFVEVVRTVVTDPEATDAVTGLARRLGKQPVVVGDRAGFIANALLFGYLNHAVTMYEQRHATREDLDAAMTLGCGLPMGPLALLDLIGLDTAHEILGTMYEQSGDRLHAPAPLLRQMVVAGMRGRKSGRGFYTYAEPGSPTVVPDGETASADTSPAAGRPVQRVGIVGSGATAAGLAGLSRAAGFDVAVVDPGGTGGTGGTGDLSDVADADLVVDATGGDPRVLAGLGQVARPGAVLATTASSVPVIESAAATGRQHDVVGLHPVERAGEVRLVEVVPTVATAPDVVETALAVCERVGTRAVRCGDRAGLVVDALLFPYLNDAVRMLAGGYAGVDDIDTAMTAGCGYPEGPFELLDRIGLDVALAVQRSLYRESREPGLAPAPLLEQLVTAGHLGRRAGRGFRVHA